MSATGIKTQILTPEFDATRDFYVRWLGLKVLDAWAGDADTGCILGLDNTGDDACLEIYRADRVSAYEGICLQFRVADAGAFCASIDGALPYRGPVERPWGSRYVYLRDPNGIAIIVHDGRI